MKPKKSRQLNVSLSIDLADRLEELCRQTGRSYQEVMRPISEGLAVLDAQSFNDAVLKIIAVLSDTTQPARRGRAAS